MTLTRSDDSKSVINMDGGRRAAALDHSLHSGRSNLPVGASIVAGAFMVSAAILIGVALTIYFGPTQTCIRAVAELQPRATAAQAEMECADTH